MYQNRYLKDVTQTNGCRIWINPDSNHEIPEKKIEIFINNLPKDFFEIDILPHFERFGPVYQFRLLIDYDNRNRGFAYLVYYYEKSALTCLDLMGYFVAKPGLILDVERSQQRSHLLALNVPSNLQYSEIEQGFRSIYPDLKNVFVRQTASKQGEMPSKNTSVLLTFPDHETALNAKRWSGVGSVNIWSRNVKILWARSEQVEELKSKDGQVKNVLIHNVPEDFDPEKLGAMMSEWVLPREIVSIRPMKTDWFIQFISTQAAFTIFKRYNGQQISNNILTTELVNQDRLKASFADFDFELRCFCLANYWDPPIFIYGRVIPYANTQLCSVIIKNNRRNSFTTFFIEMNVSHLVDIHARVCELLVLFLIDLKDLPKKNFVLKCNSSFATIGKFKVSNFKNNILILFMLLVGAIVDMYDPKLIPSKAVDNEPIYIFLDDICALSKISYELITSPMLDEIYKEYLLILKEKNPQHQFICGIFSDDNMLGCIDPIYRRGKPLNYQQDSRHMILAMCDTGSFSNVALNVGLFPCKIVSNENPIQLKFNYIEIIPISVAQREDYHFTYRPFIEFIRFDTFGQLFSRYQSTLQPQVPDPSLEMFYNPIPRVSTPNEQQNRFCFEEFFDELLNK